MNQGMHGRGSRWSLTGSGHDLQEETGSGPDRQEKPEPTLDNT